jgi:uncharacterized protein (TIGR02246 family)
MRRQIAVNDAEELVTQVLHTYRDAVLAKDVDGLVALYDSDVRIFDMWGEWSYAGSEAWRGVVDGWFGSLGTDRVAVEVDDVQTVAADGLVVVHAFVTYRGLSAAGDEQRALTNRMTLVLGRRDGEWKIVHEHTSAPVDADTGKVILQR